MAATHQNHPDTAFLDEAQAESEFIRILKQLSYACANGPDIAHDSANPERGEKEAGKYADAAGICQPLYDQIVANWQESTVLSSIRDALRAKLLSGEPAIAEAAKTILGVHP